MMQKFEAKEAVELIQRRKADAAVLVPIMLQRMLVADVNALLSLKTVICGGAPLNEVLVTETLRRLGSVLFNLYGTSEAGFSVMATPQDLERHPGSIGRPIPGVEARIADRAGHVVPPGTKGQLFLRNSWSVNGAAGRWVATGDLAYVNKEGYCFLQGRIDDMILSGGVNVYPIVTENALLQHPDVRECAVVGAADDEFGQRLVAFVVVNVPMTPEELREWLKEKVARYEMPRSIELVTELPYTAIGKPDKKKLMEKSNGAAH